MLLLRLMLLLLDLLTKVCYSATDREAEYCDERVCVSVCVCVCLSVRDPVFETTRPRFTNLYARYLWLWLGLPLAAY